jgi:transposase-like protein
VEFSPNHCPCSSPACANNPSFQYQRRGHFTRLCDGRSVQRFQCKACKRTFSSQTFRVDYRLRRSRLDLPIFLQFTSKVTQRKAAMNLKCDRGMIAHRLELWGRHCQAFHEQLMRERSRREGWQGSFLLDELETYEHNRRLKPVTVPVLVHKRSHCVLHVAVGTLPPRKPLSKANQRKLEALEALEGKRRSESRVKVAECFEALRKVTGSVPSVSVSTDEKHSYAALLRRTFGSRLEHERTNSKVQRNYWNPLFVVNHTLAMMRDGLSRLVRRNWGASKKREKLERHLWIWVAWRNYVRPITNKNQHQSAAMVAGLAPRMLAVPELLQWRIFHPGHAQ